MRCSQKVKNKIRKNKNDGRSTLKGFQDALGPHPNKHKRSLGKGLSLRTDMMNVISQESGTCAALMGGREMEPREQSGITTVSRH